MKNLRGKIVVFILLSVVLLSLVSAAGIGDSVRNVGQSFSDIVEGLKVVLEPLTGNLAPIGPYSSSDMFFAKVVFFLILMSIIVVVAEKMPLIKNTGWIVWMLAITIPLLAIRFLTSEWVLFILLPNNAFAIAVLCMLPLAIYTIFVFSAFESKTMRKAAWVFAAVVFLGLYFVRVGDIGLEIGWIYIGAVIACLALFMFDGTIKSAIAKSEIERLGAASNDAARTELQTRINEVRIRMMPADGVDPKKGTMTLEQGEKMIKDLQNRMKRVLSG